MFDIKQFHEVTYCNGLRCLIAGRTDQPFAVVRTPTATGAQGGGDRHSVGGDEGHAGADPGRDDSGKGRTGQ